LFVLHVQGPSPQHDYAAMSHYGQCRLSSPTTSIVLAAPSSAPWSTSSWQRHRQQHSTVTSCHNQRGLGSAMANVALAAPLLARLGIDITSRPTSTQQRHRQHNSAAMSRFGQCRLGSTMANIVLAASSPARLDNDIMPRPTLTRQRHGQHHLGNAIASTTRQRRRAMTNVYSASPSPA
jgi:hypothetical protein